ncbi:glycerol-3-phosphate dehydrogenase [Helicobacter sp. 13S00401-1]|uniref:(Fe-S)-binding protein n=1 Tax=Helicobacter sp. 13S00401-1 TaxID=1905758 RepID=UPI000BA57B7F|nr:(Fe-S)-binding protein [Helicobacter sp. 13S00401-1]PAF50074.1 glycerol-3-phosphate dehydrogenase [Helicobacter sp. 13S00401-1]
MSSHEHSKIESILTKTSNSCVKCGKCVPTCTIHSINQDETTSPRGYLDLVRAYADGKLAMDLNLKNAVESCFLCTTCVSVCPMSLPVDVVITKARVDIAKIYGIPFYKRAAFFLLSKRPILNIVFSLGASFSFCAFKKDGDKSILRFSFKGFKDRVMFPLNKKSFLQSYPAEIKAKTTTDFKHTTLKHNKVAIFIGCLANYNYTGVGKSLVDILQFLGIDVAIPKKQACCSAPAYFSGDLKTTVKSIRFNVKYLGEFVDKVDAFLIPEATCAAQVITDWEHALNLDTEVNGTDNKALIESLKKITSKTYLASKWLHDFTNLDSILKTKKISNTTVTYHDPCHAKKVLKVYKEPRNLLQNYPVVEMEGSDTCCGFGGVTLQSEKYGLAIKVGDNKAKLIKATNADYVSAECSACRMQIDNALYRNDIKTKFAHPLELLAKALFSSP